MAATKSGTMVGALASGSRARWLAWGCVVLYVALAGISIALETRFVGRVGLPDLWVSIVVLGYAIIGALIVNTHRSHVIGWMFLAAALSFGFLRGRGISVHSEPDRARPVRHGL